ncbi:hypothetical protein JD844_015184 [Phrynosoma platyrhinos]|uniref:Ig-like domain-containing protein n=1 Tax=Phrynosoma platyrhinos TaxID=52577 RepID=A0ABQ7T798_PHRPL|nr:hypothetical protein JD844_015184 [Phrynosoma platyrhinos]
MDNGHFGKLLTNPTGKAVLTGLQKIMAAWDNQGQAPVRPSVSLFPPSQEEIKTKGQATLACLVDGFHPGVIQVEWQADGTTISSGVETSKPMKQGDKYVASSYLTLSESDWKSHEKYACKVTHERETIEKVVNRSDCP